MFIDPSESFSRVCFRTTPLAGCSDLNIAAISNSDMPMNSTKFCPPMSESKLVTRASNLHAAIVWLGKTASSFWNSRRISHSLIILVPCWSQRIASCRLALVQAPFSSSWSPTPSDFCTALQNSWKLDIKAKAGSAQAILGYHGYSIDRVLPSNIPASCPLHTPARGLTSTRHNTIQTSRFGRPRLSIQLEALYNLARSIENVQMQLTMHHGHNPCVWGIKGSAPSASALQPFYAYFFPGHISSLQATHTALGRGFSTITLIFAPTSSTLITATNFAFIRFSVDRGFCNINLILASSWRTVIHPTNSAPVTTTNFAPIRVSRDDHEARV
ncbi:hypothetical protein P692DRAFT_20822292 [Suillus brevipes Sb2]|nr:hypothetical protein P692DRAFT_20822292 [Suillus brevipes Sb2]